MPIVEPPEPGEDPHTGVHTQGSTERTEPEDDPRLHPNFGVTPELLESIGIEVDRMPEMTDYERGWRAGRGAAVRALEDLTQHENHEDAGGGRDHRRSLLRREPKSEGGAVSLTEEEREATQDLLLALRVKQVDAPFVAHLHETGEEKHKRQRYGGADGHG